MGSAPTMPHPLLLPQEASEFCSSTLRWMILVSGAASGAMGRAIHRSDEAIITQLMGRVMGVSKIPRSDIWPK